jgi:hypothetical protein
MKILLITFIFLLNLISTGQSSEIRLIECKLFKIEKTCPPRNKGICKEETEKIGESHELREKVLLKHENRNNEFEMYIRNYGEWNKFPVFAEQENDYEVYDRSVKIDSGYFRGIIKMGIVVHDHTISVDFYHPSLKARYFGFVIGGDNPKIFTRYYNCQKYKK